MISRRTMMNDKIVKEKRKIIRLDKCKGSYFSSFHLFGKSTQNGLASPQSPVPIVSAGSVMTTGAQLFDIEEANNFNTQDGYTVSIDGQKIHVVGNNVEYPAVRLFSYRLTLPAGTYTMSIDHPVPCRIRFDSFISIPANQLSRTATFEESVDITHLAIDTEIGASFDFEFTLMLNSGSTALPWEPYTGGIPGVNPYAGEINVSVSDGGTQSQTLTLSTPGGLPGIPVTSDGNYTDESGQQWVTDEVDLAKGVYIKRIEKIASYNNESINGPYISETGELTVGARVLFALDASVEAPLSPETIVAYKQLHTYAPTTTIINDGGAGMEVGYRKVRG